MNILKIIIFGLLAFIERHPFWTLFIVLVACLAPAIFKVVGWIILGLLLLFFVLLGLGWWRMRKMRNELNNQFNQTMGGAGFGSQGGFSGFGGFSAPSGMSLEELVRQMQAQADAAKRQREGRASESTTTTTTTTSGSTTKRVNDKVGDYVEFEEVE